MMRVGGALTPAPGATVGARTAADMGAVGGKGVTPASGTMVGTDAPNKCAVLGAGQRRRRVRL